MFSALRSCALMKLKLDRDGSHVIGTSAGAIAVRSIRCLPKEAQIDNELMGHGSQETVSDTKSPGKYRNQRSFLHQPLRVMPRLQQKCKNESHPTLAAAEDGEKVDEEGATVVATAQLGELIGPMEEEGEHFSAGATAEDDIVDSPTPPKCSKGTHKSRFTCADVKARYSAEEEEGLDVFVPTPTSHNLLEVYALQNGFYTRILDIVAAFLIGKDPGATEGKPVYVRAPIEWHDLFLEWLETLNPQEQAWHKERLKEIYFCLDGNLYGRRTAGSVYRNELEEILCLRVDPQQYPFVRGQKEPCVFRCAKTGIILLHHIDDIRAAGPEKALAQLFEKELPRPCEVQAGELEREGTAVEYLGRTKIRTKDAIITVPDERHYKAVISAAGISAKDRSEVPSRQLNLLETEPLDEAQCKKYRSAVGSAIYLSLDRREIQFAVKEAARRMSNPRKCDM